MSENLNAGPVKAPKACFEEPSNVTAKSVYYRNFCNNMKADEHYTAIEAKIDAAIVTIDKFDGAILEAFSGLHGKVKARNDKEVVMKNSMDSLLGNVQDFCNANPVGATAHLESLGISWYQREPSTKDPIDIRHGKHSGSFDLLVKQPKGEFAVVWFITTTPDDSKSWVMADFSHNTHGFIDGLEKGKTYYFRAKVSSSVDGKSDWTQVIEIICL